MKEAVGYQLSAREEDSPRRRIRSAGCAGPQEGDRIVRVAGAELGWLGLSEAKPRSSGRQTNRGAGREQGLGEIRYVSDLQFVDELAPSEPVWIAD